MIEEALLRASSKNTIRWTASRNWRAQGITTVAAARGRASLRAATSWPPSAPRAPPPAATARNDLFNRNWAAQFDEEE